MLTALAIVAIFATVTIVVVLAVCIARVLAGRSSWNENAATREHTRTCFSV